MDKSSRRQFLAASAATAATGILPASLRAALAAKPAGQSLSAVRHVVVFMQENRAFDHYFGTLRGVRGYDDRTALTLRNGASVFQQPDRLGSGSVLPFHLDTATTSAQCAMDLLHSWDNTHKAFDGGAYDRWVDAKTQMTMGYFTRADIPFHYALADAFTVCDHYFCSVQGPTDPNRLYLWTGMIDPNGTGGGPAINNDTPGYTWTTYPERLQAAGVSWKVYQNANDNFGDNALALFNQYTSAAPGNPLYDRGMASVPALTGNTVQDIAAAIRADVLGGTLPQVSWVIAPESASEHPKNSPAAGADMVSQVLQALTVDPNVWASTVLLLNYDENDGYFDHIVPPLPPAGTPDEFVNGQPIGLGPRVPMIVASPWSTGGYVCSQVFDHTSVIRFLETWTGVHEPNISAWRRSLCGDLTSALNFTSSSVAVPAMPDTGPLAQQAALECATLPRPKPPATASMPAQEPGTRPARALPYQANANASLAGRTLTLAMSNGGSESVHLAVYANGRSSAPTRYDLGPGASLQASFGTWGLAGNYDYTAYGPNGFLRRFAGSATGAGRALEATARYDFSSGPANLVLTLHNGSRSAVTFTVTSNAYRGDGPWLYQVAPGATVDASWPVQSATAGWYDFTVTASSDVAFSRRLAGHVETGQPSISG